MLAASVHAGLASLIETEGTRLEGRRILLYSYGSGLAASLWSVVGRPVEGKFALGNIAAQVWATSAQTPPGFLVHALRHLQMAWSHVRRQTRLLNDRGRLKRQTQSAGIVSLD